MTDRSILPVWRGFAIVAVLLMTIGGAKAAELVMFEKAGCPWCKRWDAEIGPIYPKTDEARCAPLRRVDIHTPRPADLRDVKPVVFTPTFVVVDHGHEVGRIVGYAGEDFFWPLLSEQLEKLSEQCPK